jgi:hypothetical protein
MDTRKFCARLGILMVMAGMTIAVVIQCAAVHPTPPRYGVELMGYSTGTEAYNGECKTRPSFQECVNCCILLTQGMPPAEQGKCIDLCIAQWDIASEGGAERMIASAADTARESDFKDIVGLSRAKNLLRAARYSSHERIARMASLYCNTLKLA